MIKIRTCPICGNKKHKSLFVQRFASGLMHNIVSCDECNFVFVNNTPIQKDYDTYYKIMSKYELERDQILHKDYKNIILKFCPKSSKILDVGSSTGHLLYLLKKSGYNKLLGLEPSSQCKKLAWDKFKIEVKTSTISSFKETKKYDLIILAMILEHLSDIRNLLSKIKNLTNKNGYVFISVPDAANFHDGFEEAFGEFSVEHINFFSSNYLFNLMEDYSCIYMESKNNNLLSLWKKTDTLRKAVEKYINFSKSKLEAIKRTIDESPSEILVWGAGSLTQRLLNSTNLQDKTIKIIDSDSKLWGKSLGGIEIISPKAIKNYKFPILISSYKFREEILENIKSQKFINKIITFI
jgi:2-polyprenyl-3-methyl-5-hydroxy-6-metoxy-1,4-benzoquinol methylase